MGCFTFPTTGDANPETWSKRELKIWLKSKGLKPWAPFFSAVDGKRLLSLDYATLARITCCEPTPPQHVLKTINELRVRWNYTPLAPVAAFTFPDMAKPEGEKRRDTRESVSVLAAAHGEAIMNGDHPSTLTSPRTSIAGEAYLQDSPQIINLRNAVQGVADWAKALVPFTSVSCEEVQAYLESLGDGVGAGLVAATEASSQYGELFGAAFSLESTAAKVGVSSYNARKAADLAADTLQIVDTAWKWKHASVIEQDPKSVSIDVVTDITAHISNLETLVKPLTQQGWLLQIICNEKLKNSFDNEHNAVLTLLRVLRLDSMPAGKQLLPGDYRDTTKGVRRLLRQHGSGNVTAGLAAIKAAGDQGEGIKELARLVELGADPCGIALIMAEFAQLPLDTGIDVELYYHNLVLGSQVEPSHMYKKVFEWYSDGTSMSLPKFRKVLADLGMLENQADPASFVSASFKAADVKNEGCLSPEAFCAYYATLTTSGARQHLRAHMGLAVEDDLRRVFVSFASFGSRTELHDIDSARFYKLIKECNLISSQLTSIDVDLIFTKAKAKGVRRMNFDQFLSALQLCAARKNLTLEDIVNQVVKRGRPQVHAVRPEAVRLHDDKSTYTGVYAKGGPKSVDPPKNDLSSILDRSQADVRGVKMVAPSKTAPAMKGSSNNNFFRRSMILSTNTGGNMPPPDFLRTSLGPNHPLLKEALNISVKAASIQLPMSPRTGAARQCSGIPASPRNMNMSFKSPRPC